MEVRGLTILGHGVPDVDYFLALEHRVWRALLDGDPVADAELLTDDFVGVYPTGIADRSAHTAQLDDGPSIASYELSDERLNKISDGAAMLVYRARYARPADTQTTETMYVSSLWCRRNGNWRNSFSQDTPAG